MLVPVEHSGRFGLRHEADLVLPIHYEAVWPLPHGFWGFRLLDRFGVLSGTGELVEPCRLWGRLTTYRQLSIDDELAAVLEPAETYLAYMQTQYGQLYQLGAALCRAQEQFAEEFIRPQPSATAPVRLHGPQGHLTLHADGSWQWLPAIAERPCCLYPAEATPPCLSSATPQPADDEVLWQWRHDLTGGPDDVLTFDLSGLEPGIDGLAAQSQQADLLRLLASSGIAPALPTPDEAGLPPYRVFDLAALPAATRQACEAHLDTIFEVNDDSRVYVDQLIYLAWLWANGYVYFDPEDSMHWLDTRYDFDNSWFDHHILDYLHMHYELDRLIPLLREPISGPA